MVWPEGSAEKDQLNVSIKTLPENASIFVTMGDESKPGNDVRIMLEGASLKIDYPSKLLITARASDDGENSAFEFSTRFLPASVATKIVKKITVFRTVKEDSNDKAAGVAMVLLLILIAVAITAVAAIFIY